MTQGSETITYQAASNQNQAHGWPVPYKLAACSNASMTVYCWLAGPAMLFCAMEFSTVPGSLYSTVKYSTVQYSTVQYSTVQYSTVQYSTVQYSTVQYSTVQCNSLSCPPDWSAAIKAWLVGERTQQGSLCYIRVIHCIGGKISSNYKKKTGKNQLFNLILTGRHP